MKGVCADYVFGFRVHQDFVKEEKSYVDTVRVSSVCVYNNKNVRENYRMNDFDKKKRKITLSKKI